MPAKSRAQQKFMGAAYARKKAGHPRASDPHMPLSSLRDFAATKTSTLPARSRHSTGGNNPSNDQHARPARGYGRGPVA